MSCACKHARCSACMPSARLTQALRCKAVLKRQNQNRMAMAARSTRNLDRRPSLYICIESPYCLGSNRWGPHILGNHHLHTCGTSFPLRFTNPCHVKVAAVHMEPFSTSAVVIAITRLTYIDVEHLSLPGPCMQLLLTWSPACSTSVVKNSIYIYTQLYIFKAYNIGGLYNQG